MIVTRLHPTNWWQYVCYRCDAHLVAQSKESTEHRAYWHEQDCKGEAE